jgi:hypothetical protein
MEKLKLIYIQNPRTAIIIYNGTVAIPDPPKKVSLIARPSDCDVFAQTP